MDILTWHWADAGRAVPLVDLTELPPPQLWLVSWMGNHAEAVRLGERTVALDPNDGGAHFGLGVIYAYAGDRAASLPSLERANELAPAVPLIRAWFAYNAIALGDSARALADLQLVERMLGNNRIITFLPELAYAYSRIGRGDDARRLFDEIRTIGDRADIGVGSWVLAYLAIGDEEEALKRLEALAEKARNHEPDQGYINIMNLKMNFLADPRIEEPRFAEVLSRIRGD